MGQPIDYTGRVFDRLKALRPTNQYRGTCVKWEFVCLECGATIYESPSALRTTQKRGARISCGCLGEGYNTQFSSKRKQKDTLFQTAPKPMAKKEKRYTSADSMKCEHCGVMIPKASLFCNLCGKSVLNEEQAIKKAYNTMQEVKKRYPNDIDILAVAGMLKLLLPLVK